MTKTAWIIFSAVIVIILGGLIFLSRQNSSAIDVSNVDAFSVLAASEQSGNIADRVYNDTVSDVVLVEYGDYQCPGCAAAHPHIKTLLEEYGDRISFVYRNLPLTTIHPNALAAAAVAEAAGQQGKFWEMHDILYEEQTSWQSQDAILRTDTFRGFAARLELDIETFNADLTSAEVASKISFDRALATKVGASSTPTFTLGNELLVDSAATGIIRGDLDEVRALLDERLQ